MISFVLFPQALQPSMNFIIIGIDIVKLGGSFGAIFLSFSMKVARGNPRPLVTALCTHSPLPFTYKVSFQYYQNEEQDRDFSIIKMKNKTELTLLLLTHPTNHFP